MLPFCHLMTLLCLGQTGKDEVSLQAMQQRVQQSRVGLLNNANGPVELVPQPVFRYSDELRRIEDAGIWIWTIQGHPLAAMKVEHYQPGVHLRPWLYCFTSLSPDLVVAEWPGNPTFRASKPGVKWQRISDKAASARATRLIQMREIARRFSAEILRVAGTDERHQMRLLSRPIYRYQEQAKDVIDGAIFGFSGTGTNPDLLLLLEATTKSEWQFGLAGMTAEGLTVQLDGSIVWQLPHSAGKDHVFDNWTYFVPNN